MSDGRVIGRRWGKHITFYLDGMKLPGGSTIAGMAGKDLSNWYALQAAEYAVENWESLGGLGLLERVKQIQGAPKLVVTKAATRGTECHQVMEDLAHGRPASTTDPSVLADAEAAVRLMEQYRIVPQHAEVALLHDELLYAGTADLIASTARLGDSVLLDYKFGKHVYESHAIQLAAYAHATQRIVEEKNSGPRGGKATSTWRLDTPDFGSCWGCVWFVVRGFAGFWGG